MTSLTAEGYFGGGVWCEGGPLLHFWSINSLLQFTAHVLISLSTLCSSATGKNESKQCQIQSTSPCSPWRANLSPPFPTRPLQAPCAQAAAVDRTASSKAEVVLPPQSVPVHFFAFVWTPASLLPLHRHGYAADNGWARRALLLLTPSHPLPVTGLYKHGQVGCLRACHSTKKLLENSIAESAFYKLWNQCRYLCCQLGCSEQSSRYCNNSPPSFQDRPAGRCHSSAVVCVPVRPPPPGWGQMFRFIFR